MPSLNETIVRFEADCGLAHQFTNGGPLSDVVSEGGIYPSLAKIAATSIARLNAIQPTVTSRIYDFTDAMSVRIVHNLNTRNFTKSIINSLGEDVIAPVDILNSNEFTINFTDPETGSVTIMFYINN